MNRREFLSAASSLTIAASVPLDADAWPVHGNAYADFQGNPNVTITAIDVSGGIVCSRTSGKVPCFIQVSASAITATGTSAPYEDLSYSWNFGDASGSEIFTSYGNSAAGTAVNANNGQTGPEAAYCYRNAGTYTITLTITGKNGSGYTTVRKTQVITVTAFSAANTWYYDSNATGANNGSSAANAYTSLSTLSANVNGASGDTQIYLAKGSHWLNGSNWLTNTFIILNPAAALRISRTPGSTGADPIIELNGNTSSPGNALFKIYNTSGVSVSDVVVQNTSLLLTGTGYTGSTIVNISNSQPSKTISYVYFDNCSVSSQLSASALLGWYAIQSPSAPNGITGFGIWGGSINSLSGDLAYGTALYGGAYDWTFILGLSNINGAATSDGSLTARQHHIYASVHNHALYRWINFGSGAENASRNYCVKIDNYPPPSQVTITGYGSGAGGVVRVTVADTTYFAAGSMYIEGVTGTGAADITSSGQSSGQGIWTGNIIDGTHIDLVGTVYNAGHVYTGGDIQPVAQANYWLVDGNNITGTQRSFDANNNHGNSYASSASNCVVQNNGVHDQTGGGLTSFPIALSLTYRYNNHWNNSGQSLFFSQGVPQNTSGIFRVYKNKFYQPAAPVGSDQDSALVSFYAGGSSWANPLTFTDNIVQDMRTKAGAIGLNSYVADSAWTINRNQYYTPNATASKFLYNGTTQTTFATWQSAGFDVGGSVANPNWTDPANGVF